MIVLKELNKSFGNTKIYNNVNYVFKEKKLTCFLGASGSGKTTLLNLIAGFDSDYTGEIIVNDSKLNNLSMDKLCEYRFNNIGFVFQNYNLLKGYTVLENVLMGINLNSTETDGEKIRRSLDLLSSLGIGDKKNQNVETLSGGQKQRVAIARALVNNPKIILADEPTGALDSESTKSIMDILKDISKNKTVIIITHDEEVANYADEVIEINDYDISIKRAATEELEVVATVEGHRNKSEKPTIASKTSTSISIKNFKIHFFKFLISAIIIAFGSAAFVGALSSKKITNKVIEEFKTKNFFYNVGQTPIDKKMGKSPDEILNVLKNREDVENIYYQYDLENILLINGDKSFNIKYKVPTALSKENLVYGVMPKANNNQIAIAINVANRLTDDVKSILGKEISLQYEDKNGIITVIKLTVCGLTNSQYQDFIVSSDVEQQIYNNSSINKDDPRAISFDIKNFEEISKVDKQLKNEDIVVLTRAEQVDSFQNSFVKLINLYTALSYIILVVGMAISSLMLYKISIERYTEVGVLAALGYKMKIINSIMFKESIYFAALSTVMSCIFIFGLEAIYKIQFGYGLELNLLSFIILVGINLILTLVLANIINIKLIKTEPAKALRKN